MVAALLSVAQGGTDKHADNFESSAGWTVNKKIFNAAGKRSHGCKSYPEMFWHDVNFAWE